MGFSCGLVGLPNVGKSTLFNALTKSMNANAANYPFCTIDPNFGSVEVVDPRLQKIAEITGSKRIIYNRMEFVDIAGLIEGASRGDGLGNQFLGHIMTVDAIAYVLRCFDDDDIIHVKNAVDPVADAEVLELELILADMQSLQKRLPGLEKKSRGDKTLQPQIDAIHGILKLLEAGQPAYKYIDSDNEAVVKQLQLLTAKPSFFICNVKENDILTGNHYTKKVEQYATLTGRKSVIISAKIESEIATISSDEERQEFLDMLGITETGLNSVIRLGYDMLHMLTFFTAGPEEARAWNVDRGAFAPQAAGKIHTDFERGFICAEVVSYENYVQYGGWVKCREAGKAEIQGKTYVMNDGDVVLFRFNV